MIAASFMVRGPLLISWVGIVLALFSYLASHLLRPLASENADVGAIVHISNVAPLKRRLEFIKIILNLFIALVHVLLLMCAWLVEEHLLYLLMRCGII